MLQLKPKKLSDLAESLLWLEGKPFSLNEYPFYRTIYNGRYKSTLLMCGRQVGKSTSIANFIITESIAIPFFREYYISPSKEQTLMFSNTRLGKTLAYSPLIKKYWQSPEHADRVLHRSYTNGSENAFTYACDDADRARGYSADRCSFDEFQDMNYDAVVPVVTACMKNSKYRFELFAGTPKTMENAIQFVWERSTQSEWCMKCSGCGRWNFVQSEKSLGKHGPICLNPRCGKGLDPRVGQWVDMKKPEIDAKTGTLQQLTKGFHIPQPIMPENIALCFEGDSARQAIAQSRWDDILRDMSNYTASKFRNEVLGVSDAQGTRLISLEELKALCTGAELSRTPDYQKLEGITLTVAGVDWSGGGTTGVSRTVLWVWGYDRNHQKLRCLYYRIYPGNNPVDDVADIAQVCEAYGVSMVVGDAGEGALANATLRQRLGAHRCAMVQYGSQSKPMQWNGVDRYMADRTTLIDNFLMALKQQRAIYPPYLQAKAAIDDVLNVYEEVTHTGKKVWRHSPMLPDDALHAQLFGWIAWKLAIGDASFYQ